MTVGREAGTGRLGFSIDAMNTVVEVDPSGPIKDKLKVGDKIVAVDDQLLNFKRFVDVVGSGTQHKLRIARLRAAQTASGGSKSQKERIFSLSSKKRRSSASKAEAPSASAAVPKPTPPKTQEKAGGVAALREVKLIKESEETKIGAGGRLCTLLM